MNRDFFLLKKKMFLLILEKRDAAFPSLWTVFVLEQFGDVNFVTVLRDAGGSGERRSGCWELGGGAHGTSVRGSKRSGREEANGTVVTWSWETGTQRRVRAGSSGLAMFVGRGRGEERCAGLSWAELGMNTDLTTNSNVCYFM